MKEQKGFTLVEVLVSIAILALVLVAVGSIMVIGSKSFAKGSSDADIQEEAQLAVNQIEDLIIDINGGVSLELYTSGSRIDLAENASKTETEEKNALADEKRLVLYNAVTQDGATVYTKEQVGWKKADETITYSKWNVTYDADSASYVETGAPVYEDELLAENVADFSVDLSDIRQEMAQDGSDLTVLKSVQLAAGYVSGNKMVEYATSPVIALRNRLVKSADPKRIFDETPATEDTLKLYISGQEETYQTAVPIVDRVTEVNCGNTYNVYAMVNLNGTVNAYVDFSIEESSLSTIDSEGHLTVGSSETCQYLTIVARYKNNPARFAKGVVKVIGGTTKDLVKVQILTTSLEAFNPKYYSYVTTKDFTEEERQNDLTYKWTVSEPERVKTFTDHTSTLVLDVIRRQQNYGKTLVITLTVTSEMLHKSVSDSVVYMIDYGGKGDGYIRRGNYLGVTYDTGYTGASQITYEYYFSDAYGNRVKENDQYLDKIRFVKYGGSDFNFTIDKGLPWDREFYVCVRGYVENELIYQKIIYMPKVTLLGCTSELPWTNGWTVPSFNFYIDGVMQEKVQNFDLYSITCEECVYTCNKEGAEVSVDIVPSIVTEYADASTGTVKMQGQVNFVVTGGTKDNITEVKSITIHVQIKEHPEIDAYSDIIFK